MKNRILLIAAITILVSCNSNEQRKMEINQKMNRLNMQMNKSIEQKIQLQQQLDKMLWKYDSQLSKLSDAERRILETEFQEKINAIAAQERKLKIQDLRDEQEIRKLELEYTKL